MHIYTYKVCVCIYMYKKCWICKYVCVNMYVYIYIPTFSW